MSSFALWLRGMSRKDLFSVLADIVLDFQMFVLMGILALVAVGLKVSLAN